MSFGNSSTAYRRTGVSLLGLYMKILREHGIRASEPFVKHLEGEIWELRLLRDRILFVGWDGNRFVLLHYFMKKTQKTPEREIEQAKRNMKEFILKGALNMSKTKVSPIGSSWEDFEKRTFTPEEIMESDLRVALISELIHARRDKGITQKQLEEASGVR